ncbi:MAG: DUF3592 domain-containing protein [Chloroflexi bacterium]|nr:DUF3592 domain-containing protein [Chloroflexota bacterium]
MTPYLVLIGGGIFAAALFIGGIVAIIASLRSKNKAEESGGWPAVVGVITNAIIKKNVSSDSDGYTRTTYAPQIEYQYSVASQEFIGNRITFGMTKTYGSKKKAEEAMASYPINARVNVFYDPQNPSDAVLDRKAGGFMAGIIGGVVLILISVCVVCPILGGYAVNAFQ